MNGSNLLADTNIFIYLFNKHPIMDALLDSPWSYTFITEIELLGKPQITEREKMVVKEALSICTKIHHVQVINDITIELRQKYSIKIPDALIAASAIHSKIPLLTADKGFTNIKELDVVYLEIKPMA